MGCNYMDYSEDACLVMFTNGQSERAWLSIQQYRQGFNPSNYHLSKKPFINNYNNNKHFYELKENELPYHEIPEPNQSIQLSNKERKILINIISGNISYIQNI